jgi:hypothetical protein
MYQKGDRDNRLRMQEIIRTPKTLKKARELMGWSLNQEEMTMPERSHTTMPEQPQEGTVEDVTDRPDEYAEERTMEAGTSSQPPQWKGKQAVPRSPRRQATTTIVLPCIPEGVRIAGNMLGHVEKLRYSDHDVTDMDKFPEFSKKFYLQTVGIGPFGEPINQPVQWAAGLAKNGILGLLDIPHFGRGQYANNCVKQLMKSPMEDTCGWNRSSQ